MCAQCVLSVCPVLLSSRRPGCEHYCPTTRRPKWRARASSRSLFLTHIRAPSQAYMARPRVESFSLTADMMYISSNCPRIMRALFEICMRRNKVKAGW
jgi:hypothetical protein